MTASVIYRVNALLLFLLIPWTALTLPGLPMYKLAGQVWYVTLISHVALILACMSAVASARVERRQDNIEDKAE